MVFQAAVQDPDEAVGHDARAWWWVAPAVRWLS
jgi:hypothetical protein